MEIALHIGALLTDENTLVRCLLRNRELLAEQGIAVPSPGDYRPQLLVLSQEMLGKPTSAETQETLLDGLIEADGSLLVQYRSADKYFRPFLDLGVHKTLPDLS